MASSSSISCGGGSSICIPWRGRAAASGGGGFSVSACLSLKGRAAAAGAGGSSICRASSGGGGFLVSACLSLKGRAAAAGGCSSLCISRRGAAVATESRVNMINASYEEFSDEDERTRLMLPPAPGSHGILIARLYNFSKNTPTRGQKVETERPVNDAAILGASHGWAFTYNLRNGDMFLSDISDFPYPHHMKLPPFHTSSITNVILSGSPYYDRENCRAIMLYGRENRLVFCRPGHSTEWTSLGHTANCQGVAYSTMKKLLFCVKKLDDSVYLEAWDLRDPESPRMIRMDALVDTGDYPAAWTTRGGMDGGEIYVQDLEIVGSCGGIWRSFSCEAIYHRPNGSGWFRYKFA